MRYTDWIPNDILKANDLTDTTNNGTIQISTISEVALLPSNVNIAFCLEDFEVYKRIKFGTGVDCWEVF